MQIILKTIEDILIWIESILGFLLGLAEQLVDGSQRKEKYDAKFESSSSLLSSFNGGFNLTGRLKLSIKNSYQNVLISSPTGGGKTSVAILPSIYSMKGSFIVHDPSGEICHKTSGFQKLVSRKVKILNYSRPDISCGFNPLARANTHSEIQKVAHLLVDNALGGNNNKEQFWNLQATALLTMLICILKKQETIYQNPLNLRHLLNQLGGNPESVDTLFSEYADDVLFAEYKSFLSYDEKTISGIIATCKAALQIFSDEAVSKITAEDSIDFEDFRQMPTILYIQNSVADQKYYSVLTSIFTEQLFSYIMSRFPATSEQDIFILLDECSSLRLPTLQLAVSNVRKHRAGIMLVIQDFSQLVHIYGKNEAEAIKSNCFAKLYFSGSSLETAKELEQLLGKFEFKNKDKQRVIRPLMTNDEIRTMKSSNGILICGHYAPIKTKLVPYYKQPKYLQYSELPPIEMHSTLVKDAQLLTLSKPCLEEKELMSIGSI